jgi:aromatic-L-amino-acid/L-tryptophan decarboxylase
MGEQNRPEVGDWDPARFESHGEDLLRLLGDHFRHIRQTPVSRPSTVAEVLAQFDPAPPQTPDDFGQILADTERAVIPHLVQWNHPSFHAYFANSGSFAGILADTMISALNVNAMVWQSAPAASALETLVLGWMADMVGYPGSADGVLLNGASLATFYALVAARDSLPGLRVREQGIGGPGSPRLRLYTSEQGHSSVEKAAIALGLGLDNVVRITTDDQYRMRPEALAEAVAADLAAGHRPMAVVATVGTTTTGALDPVERIHQVCRGHGLWLHVDGAYGGFWRMVPRLAGVLPDLRGCDSLVVNPHKCLYAPMEVTALYCRRRDALANSFRLVPEYLRTDPGDAATDFMDRSLQLGRSFRALKLWWIIRGYGIQGLRARLERSADLADGLREQVAREPHWEIPASSPLPLVCLRHRPPGAKTEEEVDCANESIVHDLNASGEVFLSHGRTRAGYTIRVSIGNIRTSEEDVAKLWAALRRSAARLAENYPSNPRMIE